MAGVYTYSERGRQVAVAYEYCSVKEYVCVLLLCNPHTVVEFIQLTNLTQRNDYLYIYTNNQYYYCLKVKWFGNKMKIQI